MRTFLVLIVFALLRADVCAQTVVSNFQIEKPWTASPPPGGKVAATFMEIENKGLSSDLLVAASTPLAGAVEIHNHSMENGVMKMRAIPEIRIAAGEKASLKPQGLHLMLFDLKKPLVPGERFPLRLQFASGHTQTIDVLITERAGATNAQHHQHEGHKH